MIRLTPATVHHLLHRYRHTGEIPALAADWMRQRERIVELEKLLESLADRCAGQSEALERRANTIADFTKP